MHLLNLDVLLHMGHQVQLALQDILQVVVELEQVLILQQRAHQVVLVEAQMEEVTQQEQEVLEQQTLVVEVEQVVLTVEVWVVMVDQV
jgi:septum formation inhibitor-activating ATPase MinD